MIKITYVTHDGDEHVVIAKAGASVMETAVRSNVPGIIADCGGACACATCHVYVEPDWRAKTGQASLLEESMLDFSGKLDEGSRLSCQIKVSTELDGLVVRLPESQH